MKKPLSVLDTLSKEEMAAVIERIIYLRTNSEKMSQKDFSERLMLSQTYISLLEAGKKPLTKSALDKIISVMNVDSDWLLYGKGTAVYNESSVSKPEKFIRWYKSLPYNDQSRLADLISVFYDTINRYPPDF